MQNILNYDNKDFCLFNINDSPKLILIVNITTTVDNITWAKYKPDKKLLTTLLTKVKHEVSWISGIW